MKKRGTAIVFAAIVLILSGVLMGLAACQMGLSDSFDLGGTPTITLDTGSTGGNGGYGGGDGPFVPSYPVFAFSVTRTNAAFKSMSEYSISLTWVEAADMTDAALISKAVEAFDKWSEFERSIYPLPFYDGDDDGVAPPTTDAVGRAAYEVYDDDASEINNGDPRPIVMNRYWPASIGATTAAWNGANAAREQAFNQAVTQISVMMNSIEASPLYAGADPVLRSFYTSMAESITVPPLPLPTVIEWDGPKAALPPGGGFLYEYYRGCFPGQYAGGGNKPFP